MSHNKVEKERGIFTDRFIDGHLRNGDLKWYHWVPVVNYFYEGIIMFMVAKKEDLYKKQSMQYQLQLIYFFDASNQ